MFSPLRNPRLVLWSLAFAVSLTYFWTRGPARALGHQGNLDFEVVYNGLQTFQEGRNPYVTEDVFQVAEAHGRQYFLRHYANIRLLYAPGFLAVFGPVARLDYEAARVVWLVLEIAAIAALLVVALALSGLRGEGRQAFLLAGLCFAPIHTGLAQGQPGIFFCLLTLVFFWSLSERRLWLGAFVFGLLLGKPSFAAPAALVGLIRGHWRAVVLGCFLGALTWLPYIDRYGLHDGVIHYATAIQAVQAPGNDADDTRANPRRFDLVNLRSWLSSWHTPNLVNEGLYWVAMILAALLLYRGKHSPDTTGLYWTLAAVFCTLALYHRFYDVAAVIVGWAAALAHWNQDRRTALAMAACLLPFAVPGTAFLVQSLGTSYPAWLEATLIRHQVVALIGLGAAAFFGLLRASAKS